MPGVSALAFTTEAAQLAIEDAGLEKSDIDAVLCKGGTTPSDFSTSFLCLQTLDEALAVAGPGETIPLADGTYTPDPTGLADSREATFQLINGVTLEGGHAGCGAPDPLPGQHDDGLD